MERNMFTIRCEKCKNEVLIDKQKLYSILKGSGEIEVVAHHMYMQIVCNKCYNYIEVKE